VSLKMRDWSHTLGGEDVEGREL